MSERSMAERHALFDRWVTSPEVMDQVEELVGIADYLETDASSAAPQTAKLAVPKDSTASLIRHYGKPGTSQLTTIVFPYPMRLAWDLSKVVKSSRCHQKVKASLESILQGIFDHYGSLAAVREARMDRFGGIYNFRRMRGGSSYSRHSWGIAIDLDPDHNGLHTRRPQATMPDVVIDIFEAHGWKSGGRAWGRDYMHFQATA